MPVYKNHFESNSSSEPPKKPHKTIRLNIDLTQINREGSVILNYNKLLNEERARIEKRERGDTRDGKSEKDSKKLKFSDNRYIHSYAELGAGYDDDDSFIDNTEANEEGLPENMDTKYGGYYINSGELELKKTNRQETSSSSESSDSSRSDSSSDEEVKKPTVKKDPQDSGDSKKHTSDTEVKKKAKVINVPLREKNNSESMYSLSALKFCTQDN